MSVEGWGSDKASLWHTQLTLTDIDWSWLRTGWWSSRSSTDTRESATSQTLSSSRVWTRGTEQCWSRNILNMNLLVCWTALMEGRSLNIIVNTSWWLFARFVLKGVNYNPVDVMNILTTSRGYRLEGEPQQRTLPSIHAKDDKWVLIPEHFINWIRFLIQTMFS